MSIPGRRAIRIASCRRSAISISTYPARGTTGDSTTSSARTRVGSAMSMVSPSPSGHRAHAAVTGTPGMTGSVGKSGVTGTCKAAGKNGVTGTSPKGLWRHRPFSRVVRGWRAYKIVRNYIQLNEKEALGHIPYRKERLKGLSTSEWQTLWKC